MYDELVKRLRQLAEEQMFDFERQPYLQAADAIEELSKDRDKWKATAQEERDAYRHWFDQYQKDVPHWVPVTERLPEEDGWYQVYAPSYSGGSSSGLKNINGNMYSAFKHGKWSVEVGYQRRAL